MPINRDTLLRIIICVDFVFVSMALLADWLPKAYVLNQAIILALGFWAIVHRESVIQVELLMLIKCISIIIDSVAIGMTFQFGKHDYTVITNRTACFVISAFFAIFLLILKPIMLLLLNKVRQDRLGDASFGVWGPTSGYTSLDGH